MGTDDVKSRLDPDKSYRNFKWMYKMYRKPRMNHSIIARLCGITPGTVKNWFVKLNIGMYLKEDRETERYKIWRRKVLLRDGMRCTKCGSRKRLHAHHIRQWADYPKLRYVISNGVTLCDACHKKRHPWMTLLYDNKDERKR